MKKGVVIITAVVCVVGYVAAIPCGLLGLALLSGPGEKPAVGAVSAGAAICSPSWWTSKPHSTG